jgi:M6 family metalloprotease-like protein
MKIRFFVLILLMAAVTLPSSFAHASPAAGDLVKSASLPAVYYVSADNKRLTFPDEATYFSWYADFSQVQTIPDADLAALPLAGVATVRPGTGLVKTSLSPKVYAVGHGGILCWITTEALAQMIFGADWAKKIVTVPDEFLTAYKAGIDITMAGQYWWQREEDASPTLDADRNPSLAPETLAVTKPAEVAPPETAQAPAPTAPVVKTVKNQNTLYILWDPLRPTDAAPDKAVLQRFIFGSAPSLVDYYDEESDSRLTLTNAGMLGWYKADKNPEHYWSDDPTDHNSDGFKTGAAERIAEALKKADADFDFGKYDASGDKQLAPNELAVFVVIPQTLTDPTDAIVVPSSVEDPASAAFVADGVTITKVSELHIGSPLGEKPQFGTLLHSFATLALGLTDMSASASDKYTPGSFSLMSNHYSDLRLDPYTRITLGWAVPTVIPKATEISEQHLNSILPNRQILKVGRDSPTATSEYFLIENRQRNTYDSSLPDTGIAIWGINGSSVRLLHLDVNLPINDANALWHARSSGFSTPTGLELFWPSDGVRSGVQLTYVGASALVMDFTLIKKILTDVDVRPLEAPIR